MNSKSRTPCGKRIYTRAQVKRALLRLREKPRFANRRETRPYYCGHCQAHHLTSITDHVFKKTTKPDRVNEADLRSQIGEHDDEES